MANGDNSLPQLDMSKSVPVQQAETPPQLDMSKSVPIQSPTSTNQNTPPAGQDRGILENLAGGVMEGAAKLGTGAANLVGRGVEMATGQPKGSLQGEFKDNVEKPSIARDIGEGAENIGEYATGEGAFSKIAKLGEVPEGLLALAEKYPKTAKILLSAVKGASVGGAQGTVKGAAEEKPLAGGEGGALGGAVGGSAAELAGEFTGALAKRFGVGTTGEQDAMRGFRPGKRNFDFLDHFQKAAPVIDAEPSFKEAKNLGDQVEAIDTARENWWNQQVKPLVDKHATVPLGGINIRNSIEADIPESMKKYNPEQAAQIQKFANDFMPGQIFALQIGDAERDLQYFNAKLASTGYWSKLPAERAAMLKTNPDAIMAKSAADAIRDEMYNRLGILEPQSDMAELKKTYGALRNVGDELRGQVNVQGRQAPTSLKEAIGLITGLSLGGVKGLAVAALPMIDRNANSAEKLASRAVQKVARPGEEGVASRAFDAAGNAAKTVVPAAAAGAGRVMFEASDGTTHSVPDAELKHALAVDPHLKIIQMEQ